MKKININFISLAASLASMGLIVTSAYYKNEPPPALLNPEPRDNQQELINKLDAEARAREFQMLKQYEQADFDFMRGDAELDKKSN